jgi:hypothetical protein
MDIRFGPNERNLVCENSKSATLRSMHVLNQGNLLSELAKSENIYEFISPELEKIIEKATMMDSERQTGKDNLVSESSFQDDITCEQLIEEPESNIRDPRTSQTKGRQN